MLEVSAIVGEKASRLFEDGCVYLSQKHPDRLALVKGDSAWHTVSVTDIGVECDCRAYNRSRPSTLCSHSAAALLAWGERAACEQRHEAEPPLVDG